ncbi:MAG: molybdopterin molybdotransferase MoeA [Proteobacteria bacterium]|nr:molybdopterin molybdotransferase MoeA [Pseudomonadota bacterium]
MLAVAEARQRILSAFTPLPPEQVSLSDALGRVLAEDVASRRTQPPMAVSAMDGYAVRAADTEIIPATLEVVGAAPAGGSYQGEVNPGQCVRIFTGGPVPAGADAIVIQEDTVAEGNLVSVLETVPVGHYVRPAGLDFSEGEILLKAGATVTARDIGLAAAMNRPWLMVRRQPRVAILSTGDEVVMPGDPVGPNQIVSSNGLSLAAAVRARGGIPISLGIAPDNRETLAAMAAGARGANLLLTTGGVSVGEHDLVQSVLGEAGLDLDFWQIAMRPGKPLMFGHVHGTPVLGLPGNPVSSLVCAVIFMLPALDRMQGVVAPERPAYKAQLTVNLEENDRREDYLRASLSYSAAGASLVTPFSRQDSSMFSRLAHADCLVIRAPHATAASVGDTVEYLPLPSGMLRI